MSNEKDIFADCDADTEFAKQWFLVDPYGEIVNTVPPQGDDAKGFGEVRYMIAEDLPDGFDYKGKNISALERSVKALTFRIKKARK